MQPPENHVAMMQIDCEVMNTRLLHIHEDSIPLHLSESMRAHANNGSLQRNDSNEENGHQRGKKGHLCNSNNVICDRRRSKGEQKKPDKLFLLFCL